MYIMGIFKMYIMKSIEDHEMTANEWLVNVWIIRIIRLIILVLGWSSLIISMILSKDIGWLFSTYTIQSNSMVMVWLTIAIIFQDRYKDHPFFNGIIRGAITLYITVTFIIFAILLSPLYHPTGIAAYTNLCLHYIVPTAFILDWVFTEMNHKYAWKFIVFWLAYPIFYLIFTLILGNLTGIYIYPFLDLNLLGVTFFTIWCFILAALFLLLGTIFVFLNRKVGTYMKN